MARKHVHAEIIHAWADGAEIQRRKDDGSWWTPTGTPMFGEDYEYRIKPHAEYPLSTITDTHLSMVWAEAVDEVYGAGDKFAPRFDGHVANAIANAALAHACEVQDVVPMAKVQEVARELAKIDRDNRDMKIAIAVQNAVYGNLNNPSHSYGVAPFKLQNVIDAVK